MADEIRIRGLEVWANHGVYEEEARLGQRFVVDMTLRLDTRRAGLTDELERSVDYGEVCRFVTGRLCGERYRLIEAAAERFAMAVLERWEAVEGLNLELHKPSAPIGLPFSDVSVRIERSRHRGLCRARLEPRRPAGVSRLRRGKAPRARTQPGAEGLGLPRDKALRRGGAGRFPERLPGARDAAVPDGAAARHAGDRA